MLGFSNPLNNSSLPSWNFPDLATHHPQPNITDAQLSQAIQASWPVENGIMSIPYSFSRYTYWITDPLGALNLFIHGRQYPQIVNSQENTLVQTVVRAALNTWENASNGTLRFYRAPWYDFSGRGIFFNLLNENTLYRMGADADTIQLTDNSGMMRRADVFYISNETYWQGILAGNNNSDPWTTWWGITDIVHEIGHTLGFEHIDDYPILNTTLRNTPDGVFCSVMPSDIVSMTTPINQCQTNCTPSYAIFPGELDKQMLRITLQHKIAHCELINVESFSFNFLSTILSCIGLGFLRQSIFAFCENLETKTEVKVLTPRSSHLVADSVLTTTMIAAVVFTNLPIWLAAIATATTSAKYIPESVFNKLPYPQIAKAFLTSNVGLYLFTITKAYLQGQCLIPLFSTMLMALGSTYSGGLIGEKIGYLNAKIANKTIRGISSLAGCNQSENDIENPQAAAILDEDREGNDDEATKERTPLPIVVSTNYDTVEISPLSNVGTSRYSMFYSCIKETKGWLCCQEPDVENQLPVATISNER